MSPSISPLSYKSIRISPASVSIFFTSEFFRLLITGGGGFMLEAVGFAIECDWGILSTFVACADTDAGEGVFFAATGAVAL